MLKSVTTQEIVIFEKVKSIILFTTYSKTKQYYIKINRENIHFAITKQKN